MQQQLGARIKLLRRSRTELSQFAFAKKYGIDATYYAAIEQGRHNITILMLKKITDGLDLSLSELLEGF